MTDRDEELGRRLRDLPVPQHKPGFFEQLDARLEAEAAEVRRARRPRRARAGWRAVRPPSKPGLLRPRLVGAAAFVLVGILVATWIGLPSRQGTRPIGPRTATAAEVQQKVARAFATVTTIEGRLVEETAEIQIPERGPGEGGEIDTSTLPRTMVRQEYTFAATAAGDFAYEAADGSRRVAFSAASRTLRDATAYGKRADVIEERNVGLGPPDGGSTFWLLQRSLGSVVRAFVNERVGAGGERTNAGVEEVTYDGRPAWHVSLDVEPTRYELSPDHLDIRVDQATGFPLAVDESSKGELVRRVAVSGLKLGGTLAPSRFHLDVPAGARFHSFDTGFRQVPVEEAAGIAGYAPPVPASVPQGFERTAAVVAKTAGTTGAEGMNPPSKDVFEIAYRRGLDSITVSSRRTGPDPEAWTDPITAGEGSITHPARVQLRAGFLKSRTAEVVVEPGTPPHLWVLGSDFVVIVAGDLTRDQLITVAESLAASG